MKTWGELKEFMESHAMDDATEIRLSINVPQLGLTARGKLCGGGVTGPALHPGVVTLQGR